MPYYDFDCKKCGVVKEGFLKLSEWGNNPICCGEKTNIRLVPVSVQPDNTCYQSMITGEMITSRNRHRAHLKEHGCIEVGSEPIKQRKEWQPSKKEQFSLRNEIYQKLDGIPNK